MAVSNRGVCGRRVSSRRARRASRRLAAAPSAAGNPLGGVWEALTGDVARGLALHAAEVAIDWAVPLTGAASVGVLLLSLRAAQQKKSGPAPAGGGGAGGGLAALLGGTKANQAGANKPPEYLKVERLNEKLEALEFGLAKALRSARAADDDWRRKRFARVYGADLAAELDDTQLADIVAAEQEWQQKVARTQKELDAASRELRALVTTEAGKGGRKSEAEDEEASDEDEDDKEEKKEGGGGGGFSLGKVFGGGGQRKALEKRLAAAAAKSASDEVAYLQKVSKTLTKAQRKRLGELLKSAPSPGFAGGTAGVSPLALGAHGRGEAADAKHVFVLDFPGDVSASQVKTLRQEVTAIVGSAKPERGDEVVLVLNSGGGTVTGYGLAAAQLTRIKEAGITLTVCVEQVAASGGYMMACCGDKIVASPFAVLGSIGVISELPNVYERLQREGIEFQTVTAGEFKRTLTPFKKPTPADRKKAESDIADVLVLFKTFVGKNRPSLDIDAVATGETWYGDDALKRGLCDELKTVDDVLVGYVHGGAEVFSVKYTEPKDPAAALSSLLPAGAEAVAGGFDWRRALAAALLGGSGAALPGLQQQRSVDGIYAIDRTAESVRAEYGGWRDTYL